MCACGFYLENELSWKQAADKCYALGARLPEIYSETENTDILSLKVFINNIFLHKLRIYAKIIIF